MRVRFIRHGQSMCNLYNQTGEGSSDVCDGPGGGNSHLSKTGIEQAKELNESMKVGKGMGVYESDHNGVIEFSVEMADAYVRFDVKTSGKTPKMFLYNNTKVFVSTMNRAMETAKHAFKGFGNCKFEYTPLLEEVVAGDNYDKRYKDYLKLARQIKKLEKDDGIVSVILVCHHNTIRYMVCALSRVYETRYPNIHFNTINASYIDVQFYKHLASTNWTYCVADKGELTHTPQTTKSMTSYDASDIVMVGNAFDKNFVMEHIVSSEEGRLVIYAIDKNRPDLQTSINDLEFIKSQLPKLSVELVLVPDYILTVNVGKSSKPLKPGKVSRENAVAVRLTSGITKIIFYEKWYPIHRNYNIPGQLISLNVYSVWWVFILARDNESYKGYILETRDMVDVLFERIPNNFDVPLYVMIENQGDDNVEFEEY